MSFILSYVDQKFNPFAASFRVSADLMGKVGKIVFLADGTYKQYSPLAQRLLVKAVRRVDMAAEEGSTLITTSNVAIPWDNRSVENVAKMIVDTLASGDAIDEAAIVKNVRLLKPFRAAVGTVEHIMEEVFHEKVAPSMNQHGGAMELTNIRISDDGEIIMEIALMGSCHDCKGAEDITVKAAEMHAGEMLAHLKTQHRDNNRLQMLTIGKSRLQTVSDLAFERL